jgi:hypothetical protein
MTIQLPELPSPWLAALVFGLSASAVIGNDAVQTLGPFLSSNRDRTPRWLQGLFIGGLLVLVLLLGWWRGDGDPSWGRLASIPPPGRLGWIDLLPPLAVLGLTAWGAPVSTTVLLLAAVAPAAGRDLVLRSLLGYGLALAVALPLYLLLAGRLEPLPSSPTSGRSPTIPPASSWWPALQWLATGWLWIQWLIQDLANIYVVLPRRLEVGPLVLSLLALLLAVAVLLLGRGGPVQAIVEGKTNSHDRRSATVIDLVYGLILFGLGRWSPRPLSTTWVFLGLLAGRELALAWRQHPPPWRATGRLLTGDLVKAGAGLTVSLVLALVPGRLSATGSAAHPGMLPGSDAAPLAAPAAETLESGRPAAGAADIAADAAGGAVGADPTPGDPRQPASHGHSPAAGPGPRRAPRLIAAA